MMYTHTVKSVTIKEAKSPLDFWCFSAISICELAPTQAEPLMRPPNGVVKHCRVRQYIAPSPTAAHPSKPSSSSIEPHDIEMQRARLRDSLWAVDPFPAPVQHVGIHHLDIAATWYTSLHWPVQYDMAISGSPSV